MIYFGYDVYERLSRGHKETTVSKSMIVVGTFFFLLAAYHIYSDLQGAESSVVIQLVPIAVLFYALYEYRRIIHETDSVS